MLLRYYFWGFGQDLCFVDLQLSRPLEVVSFVHSPEALVDLLNQVLLEHEWPLQDLVYRSSRFIGLLIISLQFLLFAEEAVSVDVLKSALVSFLLY